MSPIRPFYRWGGEGLGASGAPGRASPGQGNGGSGALPAEHSRFRGPLSCSPLSRISPHSIWILLLGFSGYTLSLWLQMGRWRLRPRRPLGSGVPVYEMHYCDRGTHFSDEGLGPAHSDAQWVLFAELESAFLQPNPQASLSPTFLRPEPPAGISKVILKAL